MKGATPDAEPNPISSPMKSKTTTMGIIHHILLCQRKVNSSPAIPSLSPISRIIRMFSPGLHNGKVESICQQSSNAEVT